MRSMTLGTLIGSAALSATAAVPMAAQVVREGARTSPKDAHVTFGYLCDDRFVVRNEGPDPVRLEYGLAKNDERTSLSLNGRESVELLLSTSDDLNLYTGGKVIASARREYRDCDDVEGGGHVVVRPLVVVGGPRVIIAPYPVYRSYYDPWYHRTYFRPVVQAVIRIPISIGGRRGNDRGRDNDRGRNNRGNDRGNNRSGNNGRRR